ncbi:Gfo/Idh/MocA family oxidoreductase, partial [Streptomyces sp. NPDC001002]
MAQRGTLGVAVVGTGKMGADHVRRIQEVTSGARVSAVVDVDAERAKAVAARVDGCTAYTDPAAAMARRRHQAGHPRSVRPKRAP